MSECNHSPTVRVWEAANGQCPLCLAARLAEVQDKLSIALAANHDLRDERDSLKDWLAEAERLLGTGSLCVNDSVVGRSWHRQYAEFKKGLRLKALRELQQESEALGLYDMDSAAACEHEWVDARNEVIASGQWCKKCNAIRAADREDERE